MLPGATCIQIICRPQPSCCSLSTVNSSLTCSTLFMKQVWPRLLSPRSPAGRASHVLAGIAVGAGGTASSFAARGALLAVPQLLSRVWPFAGSAAPAGPQVLVCTLPT